MPDGRRTAGRSAVRRCVAGLIEDFARDMWAQLPQLSTADELAADVAAFGDLFSLDAADELLSSRGLRTPFIRVAKEGALVENRRFTRGGGVGALVPDQVADDRVMALFADGHTIVLQGLHRLWPPVIDFANALATELGHPAQVNAYITPPSSQGFKAHYDVHDVFVLQVAGRKRWRIHEPVRPAPRRDDPWTDHRDDVEQRASEPPLIDEVLQPGDALYLPRGYLHAAEALGGVSCHLTVGVHPVTRQSLVEALVAASLDDPELRTSLPLGTDLADPAAIADDLRTTAEALVARIRSARPSDIAARVALDAVGSRRPAPIAPLAQARALEELDGESVVSGRLHLAHVVAEAEDGQVVLTLPDRTLRLPAATGKAVRAVLEGGNLAVRDLPGLDVEDAVALTRRLVREGVAVLVMTGG